MPQNILADPFPFFLNMKTQLQRENKKGKNREKNDKFIKLE